MSCVMASSPVAAVTAGGRDRVSSGSTNTNRGSSRSLRMLRLARCSGEEITPLRVASDPVPAVVGTATIGSTSRVTSSLWGAPSKNWEIPSASGWATTAATALARSMAEPPPRASSTSVVCGWWPRICATTRSTSATVGSRVTVSSGMISRCACRSRSIAPPSSPDCSRARDPGSRKTRCPSGATSGPSSFRRPEPNTIRRGAVNS
jgi:hypothetical protein